MPTPIPGDDVRPILLIDSRHALSVVPMSMRACLAQLPVSGSFSYAGGREFFSVKRIPLAQFSTCVGEGEQREALFEDLRRMRHYDFARLVVVGDASQLIESGLPVQATPAEVQGLAAVIDVHTRVPVVFAGNESAAMTFIEGWAMLAARLRAFGGDSETALLAHERLCAQEADE